MPFASGGDRFHFFDLSADELPRTGFADEFDMDEFISEQDEGIKQEVAKAGAWVADNFYPDQLTVATLRLRAGLSQRELAAKCGIAQPHLSRYESGLHEPGVYQAAALAAALDVPLDVFVKALQQSAMNAKK